LKVTAENESAQDALINTTRAKDITVSEVLSLVSAAFLYEVLEKKLHVTGTLNQHEMSTLDRTRNWWRSLGWRQREAVYEMGFRFCQGFGDATRKLKL
jgi:hypothetical protein